MSNVEKKSRIDQLVFAFDENGIVRGAHVSNYCAVYLDGELLSDRHETVAFDPTAVELVLPSALYIHRSIELEATLAAKIREYDEYKQNSEAAISELERQSVRSISSLQAVRDKEMSDIQQAHTEAMRDMKQQLSELQAHIDEMQTKPEGV